MLERGIATEVNSAGTNASLAHLPRKNAESSVHEVEQSVPVGGAAKDSLASTWQHTPHRNSNQSFSEVTLIFEHVVVNLERKQATEPVQHMTLGLSS